MAQTPLVGIIMGSKSDLERHGGSAPRSSRSSACRSSSSSPARTAIPSASTSGPRPLPTAACKVIIAAAGKAAHLGGVVAAFTPLPVITVPMKTSDLGGLDSLLSMVQMPTGVPVACVAINGAKNAAILATQILGTSLPEYRERIVAYKQAMAQE